MTNGEVVFTMKFKVLKNAVLSNVLNSSSDYIIIQAVQGNGSITNVDLLFENVTATTEQHTGSFALFQNHPNPFGGSTNIGFNLPEHTFARLSIADPTGRVLKEVEGNFRAGFHQVVIDRKDLSATGILFYWLETPSDRAVRKMILLD